jgi:hypothetical protein
MERKLLWVVDHHWGFRRNRSTTDHMSSILQKRGGKMGI